MKKFFNLLFCLFLLNINSTNFNSNDDSTKKNVPIETINVQETVDLISSQLSDGLKQKLNKSLDSLVQTCEVHFFKLKKNKEKINNLVAEIDTLKKELHDSENENKELKKLNNKFNKSFIYSSENDVNCHDSANHEMKNMNFQNEEAQMEQELQNQELKNQNVQGKKNEQAKCINKRHKSFIYSAGNDVNCYDSLNDEIQSMKLQNEQFQMNQQLQNDEIQRNQVFRDLELKNNQQFQMQEIIKLQSQNFKEKKDDKGKLAKFFNFSIYLGITTLIFGAIYYLYIYEPPVDEELVALAEELEKRSKEPVLIPGSNCTWQEYYAYKGWDPNTGDVYEKTEEKKEDESKCEKTEESKTDSKKVESKGKKIEGSTTDDSKKLKNSKS